MEREQRKRKEGQVQRWQVAKERGNKLETSARSWPNLDEYIYKQSGAHRVAEPPTIVAKNALAMDTKYLFEEVRQIG